MSAQFEENTTVMTIFGASPNATKQKQKLGLSVPVFIIRSWQDAESTGPSQNLDIFLGCE